MPMRSTRILIFVALITSLAFGATAQELELETIEFHSASVDRTKIQHPASAELRGVDRPLPGALSAPRTDANYTAWGLSNGAPSTPDCMTT